MILAGGDWTRTERLSVMHEASKRPDEVDLILHVQIDLVVTVMRRCATAQLCVDTSSLQSESDNLS